MASKYANPHRILTNFRINHLFKNIESENEPGGPDRKQVTNLNRISGNAEEYQDRISATADDTGSSQLKLNLNLDVQVQNGKPSRLALPHGELVVMFLPKRGGQNQPGGMPGKVFSLTILLNWIVLSFCLSDETGSLD